jgi:hypothetical protein
MTASYSCFLAGLVLLWPAILVLAEHIGRTRPGWALWGGAMAVLGLFARVFHAGVDHLAFQLTADRGPEEATRAVADAYGAWHLMSVFSVAIMAGWIVLAVGAVRAKTLGWFRAAALAATALLPLGVLKGTTLVSIVAVVGLAIALVPLGIRVLRKGPVPHPRALLGWIAGMLLVIGGMAFAGTLG